MQRSENANEPAQDAQSVSAVRGGDVERYRELVERHERRVFAVAWSRLGDAALAEEATQEAFIRGYRRLWMLGNGEKFSGWITAIARRAAINLGLRHRRELNKRARWALEQTEVNFPNEPPEACTPETLRQAMEELPAAHRECLVVFYLEGRSGTDAAAALGISEAAFRVRLHRARAVLREHLEHKLEGSLEKLRPAKSLVPAVMAAVLVSSSAKAAAGGTAAVGAGAKIASLLGKTALFSWFVPLIGLIGALPGVGFAWIIERMERRNFRDKDGFRLKLRREFFKSFAWGYPLMLVLMVVLVSSLLIFGKIGKININFFIAGFFIILTLISARSLTILRNSFQVGMFAYTAILTASISALALGWIPLRLSQLPMLVASFLFLLILKKRPTRMDYSLFLRASEDLLKFNTNEDQTPPAMRFDRRSLLAFARFLGSRYLVSNFRWEEGGLVLRLPPVRTSFLANMNSVFMPPITRGCPHILLGWDGTVVAHSGSKDAADLSALKPAKRFDMPELEGFVAEGVRQAWREFREGNQTAAEKALGEWPEAEVFLVPPARAKATRWLQLFLGVCVLVILVAMILANCHPVWLSQVKAVPLTEAQVRNFLSDINTNEAQNGVIEPPNSPTMVLDVCQVFPSTNLFSVKSLQQMRQKVLVDSGFKGQGRERWEISGVCGSPLLRRAIGAGWFDWSDFGLKRQDVTQYLHHNQKNNAILLNWEYLLSRGESWSWVKEERFQVKRILDYGLFQLRWLREVDCLDLVDREKVIQQIVPVQVLSGKAPPGQPPIHDWRDVHGLFFTPGCPALEDTYFAVAALQIVGGLDRIDREACIQGILRLHHGEGYFDSPNSGGYNEYKVDGAARDTLSAFESLRILGALDRVKDLDRWKFRVRRFDAGKPESGLNWPMVEAWVCQQRMERVLRERKDNPKAPVRSLLEP